MKNSIEEIKANLNFREIFKEYFPEQYQEHGNSHCPFHDDRNPSFMVTNDHGICYAGCTPDSKSKRWDVIDLHERRFSVSRNQALKDLTKRGRVDAGSKTTTIKGQLVKVYDYRDDQGKVAYSKLRYVPKSFSWGRPDPDNSNKYIAGLGAVKRRLYNLPAILSSLPETPVVFVEGEKDADALSKLGFISTTVGSSQGWAKLVGEHEVHKPLTGRTVWIIPDKDEPGRKFGIQVAASLQPVCRVVKLFELPGDGIKDAHDYISVNGPESGEKIIALADKAAIFTVAAGYPQRSKEKQIQLEDEKLTKFQKLDRCLRNSDWELFKDQYGQNWVNAENAGHRENMELAGSRFSNLLRARFRDMYDQGIERHLIEQVLGPINHELRGVPNFRFIESRVAWSADKDKILIDSGRPDWAVYEINGDGWRLTCPHANPFRRDTDIEAFECDEKTPEASWDDLFSIVRAQDAVSQDLIKIFLSVSLVPGIGKPGLIVNGPPEMGKSTFAKIIRNIVDPHSDPLVDGNKKDPYDLKLALYDHYLPVFDNMNNLNLEASDIFCQATTGISFQKRTLYANKRMTTLRVKSSWILTGVKIPGSMSDFLSRAFLVSVKELPAAERRSEMEINTEFQRIKPGLQALIFNTISTGLQKICSVRTLGFQRMGDAHRFSLAMAEKLKLDEKTIDELWKSNRETQTKETLSAEPLAEIVIAFMESRREWNGIPSQLYKDLCAWVRNKGESPEQIPREKHIRSRLRYIQAALKTEGICINEPPRGKDRRFTITHEPVRLVPKQSQTQIVKDKTGFDAPTISDGSNICDSLDNVDNVIIVNKPTKEIVSDNARQWNSEGFKGAFCRSGCKHFQEPDYCLYLRGTVSDLTCPYTAKIKQYSRPNDTGRSLPCSQLN